MICTRVSASQLVVMLAMLCGCNSSEFAAQHFPELEKDCTESLRCNPGMLASATADSVDECVHKAGSELEAEGALKQQLFLDTVTRCQQLQVCDYLSCTSTDPNSGWAAMNAGLIVNECQQRIACRIASGQMLTMSAVTDCESQNANSYNAGGPTVQAVLVQKSAKCMGQIGCAWVNCQ